MRGDISRLENRREIQVKRSFLNKNCLLRLKKEQCNGCGVCAEICPKEAIIENPPIVIEGKLTKKPTIDFDIKACVLCGECAVLCPLNALEMELNGEQISTIVKNEAFPFLVKEIKVEKEKCKPECEVKCEAECPKEAIKVITERLKNGRLIKINDVKIDESLCHYCKRCEFACPLGAIQVKKPLRGTIKLNVDLCPEGCNACVDVCPTGAIQMNGEITVSPEFCVFCSACQKVCPEKAIIVEREWVHHTDIRAAAWLTALKKLTSVETVAKELSNKSVKKRITRIRNK